MQEEFGKAFNNEGVELFCSCSYFNNYVCDFTFHAKGINQINTHDFAIVGDIVDVDEDVIHVTLRRRVLPSNRQNVTLVYNISRRCMNYSAKKIGLSIEPDDNGENGWRTLLGIIGKSYTHNLLNVFDD